MQLPDSVRILMERLEEAGFEAYAVGGAVRDCIRGVVPYDWDVTTSALPEEIEACFSHTHPTGIAHGTVTVISDSMPVEVTSYRSDGEYLDHRHPSGVRFGCSLREDLARRDFTVNAIAYSPKRGWFDPFGGREDIAARLIRAVGDPARRFSEDALRIMRALRFSAVLGYDIEEHTACALRGMITDLKNVSAERIQKEFFRLAGGENMRAVLEDYPCLFDFLFPELQRSEEEYRLLCRLAAGEEDIHLRLAILFTDRRLSAEDNAALAVRLLKRLKCANRDVDAVREILLFGGDFPEDPVDRKLLWAAKRELFSAFAAYHCLFAGEDRRALESFAQKLAQSTECLTLSALSVTGRDLQELGFSGKDIAEALRLLLRAVAAGELSNCPDDLLKRAEEYRKTKNQTPSQGV